MPLHAAAGAGAAPFPSPAGADRFDPWARYRRWVGCLLPDFRERLGKTRTRTVGPSFPLKSGFPY
jgi:hypothetical protein